MDKLMSNNTDNPEKRTNTNFIEDIIDKHLEEGVYKEVRTRFPPEPNGYLHIGHAKSIILNFGLAEKYKGVYHLRFDDTNPMKEEQKYIDSIMEDIRWLGFDWGDNLFFASDYFEKLYEYAVDLIKKGKAYVDDLNPDEIRDYRGTPTEAGKESPYRNRSIEENLELFEKMKNGEFKNGEKTLRAKIDMASPNLNMRDPVMYRILHAPHPRTGDKWCIYPMYDWAHGQSDSIEKITHSICTLEFEIHRPLYNWFIEQLGIHHSTQIEFARGVVTHTVMSKRHLLTLVNKGIVDGWDDPRMPTISGVRRRGYTPEALKSFWNRVGVAKTNSLIDASLLEHFVREDLNKRAPRVMAVLKPLKVIIDNYPDDKEEYLDADNNPEDPESGTRKVPFSKIIYIEKDDFMIDPPRKYFRLSPGKEIRLKHAYYIKCVDYVKDNNGEVTEVHCTYDPESRGGWSKDGRKVKGTSHWVSAKHAIKGEVRLYDNLFLAEEPGETTGDFMDDLNPNSLEVLEECLLEPSLAEVKPEEKFQFLRMGYFCVDKYSGKNGKLIFNKTIGLKDTWAKLKKKAK
jgi:glutaminyl-tRNA synthetase